MKIKAFLVVIVFFSATVLVYAVYPRAGYQAELSTLFHAVSGTATIVDEDTLLVEHFYYDGPAPAVYFYLGTEDDSAAFAAGIPIGPQLTIDYVDETLVLDLPDPQTFDGYNAISVWCEDVSVNFGSSTFIDPVPALAWIFENNFTTSYVLDAYSPADIPFGTIDQENPTLLLHLGQRYQVNVVNYGVHPFEVLAKGPTSGDDVVLLSMQTGDSGTLEGDSTIGWIDDGAGTVQFTLSQSLYDAMTVPNKQPGYRCGIHTGSMRGDFDVCQSRPEGDINGDCRTNMLDFVLFSSSWLDNNISP